MAESPILETARLRLEPFSETHLTSRYVNWLNDAETMRFSRWSGVPQTLDSCRKYWQAFGGTPHYFWAIVANDPALGHIGNISAHVDQQHRFADVSLLIGERRVWGRGYGTEAWRRACDFLLADMQLRKVTGGTVAPNVGMISIMRKAGMQDDGRRVRQYLIRGEEVDVVHMAIFAPDRTGG
jgi:ribosomal-protein-alanine N-acetyltransferase